MLINFTKMHGCGNDYIFIDCINSYRRVKFSGDLIKKLSDRRFGIGGDGVILICSSIVADAKMRIFNSDGSEGKMCGNGIRCVVKFLYDNNIIRKKNTKIETLSGIKTIKVIKLNENNVEMVEVNMGKPEFDSKKVPTIIEQNEVINYPIEILNNTYNITCVSMGNPHCVVFCEDLNTIDLEKVGPLFENNEIFPEKINIEFVKIINEETIEMRVWERGSGETYACGTGASAAVAAAVKNNYCKPNSNITVKLKGGDLTINYKNDSILMTGPATTVFEGTIEI